MSRDEERRKRVVVPRKITGYTRRAFTGIRRTRSRGLKWDYIRQERPRRHARNVYATRFDRTMALEARAAQNIRGSLQERLFYKALTDWGLIPGIDFEFQGSMFGGRGKFGGLVVDFVFESVRTIVQVQSVWHTLSLFHERRDDSHAMSLQAMGYTVLEIWPINIEDPVALDMWIERNIMGLFGTTAQGLGRSSGVNTLAFLSFFIPTLKDILRKVYVILELLNVT